MDLLIYEGNLTGDTSPQKHTFSTFVSMAHPFASLPFTHEFVADF